MNEAKQQRPLELISSGLCLAHPRGWFVQTTLNDLLTCESKGQVFQSLAWPPTGPAQNMSGCQQSLVNMKHSFPGRETDFEFGLSLFLLKNNRIDSWLEKRQLFQIRCNFEFSQHWFNRFYPGYFSVQRVLLSPRKTVVDSHVHCDLALCFVI